MILISPEPVSHAANVRYNDDSLMIFSGVPQELMVSYAKPYVKLW